MKIIIKILKPTKILLVCLVVLELVLVGAISQSIVFGFYGYRFDERLLNLFVLVFKKKCRFLEVAFA